MGFWDQFGQAATQQIAQGPSVWQSILGQRQEKGRMLLQALMGLPAGDVRQKAMAQYSPQLQKSGYGDIAGLIGLVPKPQAEVRAEEQFGREKTTWEQADVDRNAAIIAQMPPMVAFKNKAKIIQQFGEEAWNRALPPIQAKLFQERKALGEKMRARRERKEQTQYERGRQTRLEGFEERRVEVDENRLQFVLDQAKAKQVRTGLPLSPESQEYLAVLDQILQIEKYIHEPLTVEDLTDDDRAESERRRTEYVPVLEALNRSIGRETGDEPALAPPRGEGAPASNFDSMMEQGEGMFPGEQ